MNFAELHYQFEMIHPFEKYNGIVGRIIVLTILCNIVGEAKPLICLSEHLYHNKNEYFDLLQTTQYSGGYIRWIKFCINAINETAKRSAQLLIQYEDIVAKDIKQLEDIQLLPKSVWRVYNYLKLFPVTSISHAATQLGSSFNSISNALHLLQFRIWATSILKEYMKKGFALDDDRLKNLGGGNYFDELLAHIRDIRSSEKVFWRKVLEIYAISIDYDPKAKSSLIFFKQV